jgi:hypothetical protein
MNKLNKIQPFTNMKDCPKYKGCSAPLCPLDSKVFRRNFLKDEKICFYMLELVKNDGKSIMTGVLGDKNTNLILSVTNKLKYIHPPLKKALNKASLTPSRIGIQGI